MPTLTATEMTVARDCTQRRVRLCHTISSIGLRRESLPSRRSVPSRLQSHHGEEHTDCLEPCPARVTGASAAGPDDPGLRHQRCQGAQNQQEETAQTARLAAGQQEQRQRYQHGLIPGDEQVQWWIDLLVREGRLRKDQIQASDVYTNTFNPYNQKRR